MWDQITPAEIERAKHRLARKRAETLMRHEEELNRLDIDQHEVEILARLVTAFAKKHLAPFAPPSTVSEVNSTSSSDTTDLEFPTDGETTSSSKAPA